MHPSLFYGGGSRDLERDGTVICQPIKAFSSAGGQTAFDFPAKCISVAFMEARVVNTLP